MQLKSPSPPWHLFKKREGRAKSLRTAYCPEHSQDPGINNWEEKKNNQVAGQDVWENSSPVPFISMQFKTWHSISSNQASKPQQKYNIQNRWKGDVEEKREGHLCNGPFDSRCQKHWAFHLSYGNNQSWEWRHHKRMLIQAVFTTAKLSVTEQ